jgi:hypothetical protein
LAREIGLPANHHGHWYHNHLR